MLSSSPEAGNKHADTPAAHQGSQAHQARQARVILFEALRIVWTP